MSENWYWYQTGPLRTDVPPPDCRPQNVGTIQRPPALPQPVVPRSRRSRYRVRPRLRSLTLPTIAEHRPLPPIPDEIPDLLPQLKVPRPSCFSRFRVRPRPYVSILPSIPEHPLPPLPGDTTGAFPQPEAPRPSRFGFRVHYRPRTSTLPHITPHPLPPIPNERSGSEQAIAASTSKTAAMAGNNSNAFPTLDTSFNNRGPGPATGSHINGANGINNNASYMQPLPVGHQQDLNYLYAQIQELSAILQSNREKVNDITQTAEEVARRANLSNGLPHEPGDQGSDKARIRELEHALAKANKLVDLYKHEQKENVLLIAQYEDALGTATEQIRNYCNDIDSKFLAQRRHFNNLLQAEKDEHLQSRLDRDSWQAETLRGWEMIRTASRLRNDEWCDEYRVVRGLQEEVRCLRRCLGMEPEKPEEETGWEYLKEDPSQNPYHPSHGPQQQQQTQA